MESQPQNAELCRLWSYIISMESQPQNPEFKNNPEKLLPMY